jgi:hypothetical protein
LTGGRQFRDSFDALHEAAMARSGLSDFGPTDYYEGLHCLLESFDRDVHFTESGVPAAKRQIGGVLVARLLTEEGWKRHPDYRQQQIKQPIVIVGLPRTGTTALHALLALDDRFQGIEAWLTTAPMVRPPRTQWQHDPYYQAYADSRRALMTNMPELAAIHNTGPEDFEESVQLSPQNFVSNKFCGQCAIGYDAWWFGRSERSSYLRFADTMRLIGLNDSRRWLLKCPSHLFDMESLFAIFPDACVVQTHRDPAEAIPSICSYLDVMRRGIYVGANTKPGLRGPVEAVKWLYATNRSDATRIGRESQFCDVQHRQLTTDPIGTVRRIYAHFGLDLREETIPRLQAWLREQPKEQKGGHSYSAQDFGLHSPALREMYANYIQSYDL